MDYLLAELKSAFKEDGEQSAVIHSTIWMQQLFADNLAHFLKVDDHYCSFMLKIDTVSFIYKCIEIFL